MTKPQYDRDRERAKINAELSDIAKAVRLQQAQVGLLMECSRAITKAEYLNKAIDLASDLGLSQSDADGVLMKNVGLSTLDTAKVAIGYRVAAVRALKQSRALDAQINALKIGGK